MRASGALCLAAATAAAAVMVVMVGCTRPAPGVCCTSASDCESIGVSDSERTCSMGLACTDHECTVPVVPDSSVGCTTNDDCPAATPTCDLTTHTCVPCGSDADCASEVCDQDKGTCNAADTVLYAAPTGSDGASCGSADPCSIAHAFATASSAKSTVKLEPGSYTANLSIASQSLFVDGFGATINAGSAGSTDSIDIGNDGTLRLLGASLVNDNGDGIVCQPSDLAMVGTLVIEQASIDVAGAPLKLLNCNSTVSRSHLRVRSSTGGGFAVFMGEGLSTIDRTLIEGGAVFAAQDSTCTVTNSVIRDAGSLGAFLGGQFNAPARTPATGTSGAMIVSFSTIINSTIQCFDGAPTCAGGTQGGSCVDNTAFLDTVAGAPADTIGAGSSCVLNYSIVFPQTTAVTGTNNQVGVNPTMVDPTNGDYHLQPGSPAVDAADPARDGTPDFDGVTRPQGPRSDIGAFERKQ